MYRGSAYILLGRWIYANDHMYIENLAVNEKQCPPFCQPFFFFFGGGVYPFLSSAQITIPKVEKTQNLHEVIDFSNKYERCVSQVASERKTNTDRSGVAMTRTVE